MDKKKILYCLLAALLSSFVFFTGSTNAIAPEEIYRVYLSGETIGFINSKDKLEKYIDAEQKEIKEKYSVDKVYSPNNLDIIKEISYNKEISKEEEIYEKIKDIAPFTIRGYTITIKGTEKNTETGVEKTEDKKIYVLNKEIYETAILRTMTAFIPEKDYRAFADNTQEEIVTTGTIIEDIYIKNKEVIAEGNISTDEKIFTTEEELSRYLLFGTLEEQPKYKVKSNDTIADIAFSNRLSTEEFLIANPQFTSSDNLLFPGQTVNLALIKPLVQFVEEKHVVEDVVKTYNTQIEYDDSFAYGTEKVKQEGINGIDRITKKLQIVNGEITYAGIGETYEIKPAVDKIIVKGSKRSQVAVPGIWYWPTLKPYIISSPYGYRDGKLHEGMDISGCGYGSPIYAANNGTVVEAGYKSINGNYVLLDHGNGYYTIYAHFSHINVSVGQIVSMGEVIGGMGHSGLATGTHLHFAIYKGYPYRGGAPIQPMSLWR